MIITLKLLPFKVKIFSILLLIGSLCSAYLYFWGGKPDVFNVKVYALLSVYLQKQTFAFIQTNLLDELAAILFILGLVLFSFSKERKELENYPTLRGKAFIQALIISLSIWIILFLLIYGMAIFIISSGIFILFFIIYNLLFYIYIISAKYQKPV